MADTEDTEDMVESYGPPESPYLRNEMHSVPTPDGGRAVNNTFIVRKQSSPQQFPSGACGVGSDH